MFNTKFNYIIYQAEADEQFSSNLNELIANCHGKYEILSDEKKKKIDSFEDLSNILNSLDQLIFYINHYKKKKTLKNFQYKISYPVLKMLLNSVKTLKN